MVPTAIYIKSPGIITSQLLLIQAQYLEFRRRLDGLFRMEALIVLLNLLRVVSPCKYFLQFTTLLGIYLFL